MSVHLGEQIEEYVLGRLTGPARDAAEEHLLACRECFAAATILDAAVAVGRERERELFGGIERAGARARARARKPIPLPTWRIPRLAQAAAAIWQRPAWGAITGALAAGLVLFVLGREPGIDTGGLAHLEAYPLPAEIMRSPGPASSERAAGLADYQAGRYAEAARRLGRHLAAEPGDHEARFYLAVSLLLAGHPREAIPHLEERVASSAGYLRDGWYLAQAYLAIGEPDAARPYLRQVAASDWVHAARAREQLAALPAPGTRN